VGVNFHPAVHRLGARPPIRQPVAHSRANEVKLASLSSDRFRTLHLEACPVRFHGGVRAQARPWQEPRRPLPRQGGTWRGCFLCSRPHTFSNLICETAFSAAGASTSSVCLH
jgi:hypothetical protein